jgi:predicted GNAT family acetyltransferase
MTAHGRPTVEHHPERSRYELVIDDEVVGIADYHMGDEGALVFPHTQIDPSHRGQGLGAVLVAGALDDVRARGARVIPRCWYVAQYIHDHPEHHDLLAP